jgi:alpha-L-fucosidase
VEFVTRGRITIRDNSIYLIIRFWDGQPEMRIADLVGELRRATLLTTGQELSFSQDATAITLRGLPSESPSRLFPVIRLDFASPPSTTTWGHERLWSGDPLRIAEWAATRGSTPWVDGQPRPSISITSA